MSISSNDDILSNNDIKKVEKSDKKRDTKFEDIFNGIIQGAKKRYGDYVSQVNYIIDNFLVEILFFIFFFQN